MSNYAIVPVEIKRGETVIATCDTLHIAINYELSAPTMDVYYSVQSLSEGYIGWDGGMVYGSDVLDNWGTDDMYIVNLVATAAGVTLA